MNYIKFSTVIILTNSTREKFVWIIIIIIIIIIGYFIE